MSNILPSERPQQSRAAIEAIAKAAGIKDQIYVIGIRGYFRDSMGKPLKNDFNIYDDALFIRTPTRILCFNGNTDPSNHNPGVAVLLAEVVHRYKRGLHGISGDHPYKAWIPNTLGKKVPVIRNGQTEITTGVALNIHRGGYNTTSSLGCQTLHPEQWDEFDSELEAALKATKQSDFAYYIHVKEDRK